MITEQGVAVPDDMAQALRREPEAMAAFAAMRPARQREYVDWVGRSGNPEGRSDRLGALASHVLADPRDG